MSTDDDASALPDILEPVILGLRLPNGASAELPCRVLDIEEDADGDPLVVVGRPDLSGLADAGTLPHEGDEMRLLWPRRSGQMQLPVAADDGNRPYGPVWLLTPTGDATHEQRRHYFRIPLTLPAVVTPLVDGTPDQAAARRVTLVEVGEGGAVVSAPTGLPEVGSLVELAFTLHDKPVNAEAEVLRHEAPLNGRPRAAMRFLDPTVYGDHIRRAAFSVQRSRARLQ